MFLLINYYTLADIVPSLNHNFFALIRVLNFFLINCLGFWERCNCCSNNISGKASWCIQGNLFPPFSSMLHVFLECIFVAFCQGEDLIISSIFKVDFGDFQFMRIEPKVVRYVSGVATALLGSGGVYTILLVSFF